MRGVNLTGFEDLLYKNLVIYPNPTENILRVKFEGPLSGDIILRIIDLRGMVIRTIKVYKKSEVFNYDWDIADLSNGEYLLEISSKQSTVIRKIVKQ